MVRCAVLVSISLLALLYCSLGRALPRIRWCWIEVLLLLLLLPVDVGADVVLLPLGMFPPLSFHLGLASVQGYRNKCEFTLSLAADGLATTGFRAARFEAGVPITVESPKDCPQVRAYVCVTLLPANVLLSLLRHNESPKNCPPGVCVILLPSDCDVLELVAMGSTRPKTALILSEGAEERAV